MTDGLIGKLGLPKSSTVHKDGSRTDIWEFYEGSVTGWKVGRGTFHLLADIVTLTLWEISAWPSELAMKGDKLTARAEFDPDGMATSFEIRGRKEEVLAKVHAPAEEEVEY